jgi:hypothetical protein
MTGVSNRLESGDLSALALIGDHELMPIEILQHMLAGQAVWDALIEYDEKCAAVGPVLHSFSPVSKKTKRLAVRKSWRTVRPEVSVWETRMSGERTTRRVMDRTISLDQKRE